MAIIKIHRPNNSIGRIRKFKVYVDNEKIGAVSNGETQEFQIASGKHNIYCKQDIFNSPFIYNFYVEENETKTLTVQYLNKPAYSIVMVLGFLASAFFSQWITAFFKINQEFWIAFYIVFIVILLFLMKTAKLFTIYISEKITSI